MILGFCRVRLVQAQQEVVIRVQEEGEDGVETTQMSTTR